MSLLRFAIQANAIPDEDERDAPSILRFLPSKDAVATTARNARRFERDQAELDAIVAARPVGTGPIPLEPKSIHSPAPKSRISREPPAKRRTTAGRKRVVAVEDGLPCAESGRTFHRPVRSVRWPGDEGY